MNIGNNFGSGNEENPMEQWEYLTLFLEANKQEADSMAYSIDAE